MKNFRSYSMVAVLTALVAIQFAPVQRTNPRVTREIRWDSAQTEALARRACFDCHSNETDWPWYAWVAPLSWRVAGHVADGRRHLNFSTWDVPNEDLDEIEEVLTEREMPLKDYRLIHAHARLTDEEYEQLLAGFRATYAADPAILRQQPGTAGPDSLGAPESMEGAGADSLSAPAAADS